MEYKKLLDIYKFIFEKTDNGICVVDSSGQLIFFNKKICELQGVSIDEFKRRRDLEIVGFDGGKGGLLRVLTDGQAILNEKKTSGMKRVKK